MTFDLYICFIFAPRDVFNRRRTINFRMANARHRFRSLSVNILFGRICDLLLSMGMFAPILDVCITERRLFSKPKIRNRQKLAMNSFVRLLPKIGFRLPTIFHNFAVKIRWTLSCDVICVRRVRCGLAQFLISSDDVPGHKSHKQ